MRTAVFVIRWKVAIARTRWTPELLRRSLLVPLTLLTFGYVTATRIPDGTSTTKRDGGAGQIGKRATRHHFAALHVQVWLRSKLTRSRSVFGTPVRKNLVFSALRMPSGIALE